jgi:hypothetical protein
VTLAGAFLYIDVFSTGSLVTTISATDESGAFTFTVDSGAFDTVASTGQAHLTATITELILDEWSVSTVIAGLDLEDLSPDGATGVVGTIGGVITLLPIDNTVTLDPRDFSLTVGAVCF